VLLCWCVVLVILFFRKRSSVPRVFTGVLWVVTLVGFATLAYIGLAGLDDEYSLAKLIRQSSGDVFFAAVWTAYFARSSRVAATFRERLGPEAEMTERSTRTHGEFIAMKWFMEVLTKKYATFAGRARRSEYWYFMLFYFLAVVLLTVIDVFTGMYNEEAGIGLLSALFMIATILPSLAVTVRRLHDTDRSGWWVLLNLIPVIGVLVVLVFTVLDSQPGANRFGPNPKGVMGPGTPGPAAAHDVPR
jgi:uncharacterized membrane protein YhaH (DUF805 family)